MASHVKDLCRALQRRRNLVEAILPMYKSINLNQVQGLQEVEADFYSYFGGEWHKNKIWTGTIYGIAVTFIEIFHLSGFLIGTFFMDMGMTLKGQHGYRIPISWRGNAYLCN